MGINRITSGALRIVTAIATHPVVYFIALLGLCAAYLQGGGQKLLDFNGAVGEAQHFGLVPAVPIAIATIVTELGASALILSGYYRWVGALWLAGFTLVATFVANRFWELPMPDRFMVENAFFEHLGLIGGFRLTISRAEGSCDRAAITDGSSSLMNCRAHHPSSCRSSSQALSTTAGISPGWGGRI